MMTLLGSVALFPIQRSGQVDCFQCRQQIELNLEFCSSTIMLTIRSHLMEILLYFIWLPKSRWKDEQMSSWPAVGALLSIRFRERRNCWAATWARVVAVGISTPQWDGQTPTSPPAPPAPRVPRTPGESSVWRGRFPQADGNRWASDLGSWESRESETPRESFYNRNYWSYWTLDTGHTPWWAVFAPRPLRRWTTEPLEAWEHLGNINVTPLSEEICSGKHNSKIHTANTS